ncbi:hypothetical protein NQ317_019754 [Molorchus minor]|uniref:Uncharacterized protein n=1 Tax=Molorchus minor TaxID=1323400 RepID=A0ABQ9K6B9_9CUCU|nr:hypothetical protein NQ317_019754 [Molorchus minor]
MKRNAAHSAIDFISMHTHRKNIYFFYGTLIRNTATIGVKQSTDYRGYQRVSAICRSKKKKNWLKA